MKGNQNEGHIQFQPPGAAELERHPPADSVCARFRGMLRDYADQDLSPATHQQVDEHLHACRDCSLALSRAELEVMRIRAALTGRRPGQERGPIGPARPPRGFAADVLGRLQKQPAAAAPRRGYRWWILLPAAALLAVGIRLGGGWIQDDAAPVVRVLDAVDATWSDPGGAVPATRGQGRVGGLLTVGVRGHADLAWTPEGVDPATVFQIEGDSRLHVDDTATLYHGAMTVRSSEGRVVVVPGARPIHLGVGEYHIFAIPSDRHDSALTAETVTRVRLEVLEGRPAEVGSTRDTQRRRILQGEVAHYDGWSPVLVDRALSEERLGAMLRQRPSVAVTGNPSRPGLWLGRLMGPDGQELADTTVHVNSSLGPEDVQTDVQGRFRLNQLEAYRGTDVVVQVDPRWPGVAVYGPVPVAVPYDPDAEGLLLGTLQLQPERPVSGRVRDEGFRGVSGARIVPLLVDELLGLVEPLWNLATWTGDDGEFALHRLPASLEPHTSLVLLVDHADHPPSLSHVLTGIPQPEYDRLLDIALETGEPGELRNMAPGETVDVAYELPGLPNRALVWIEVSADESGTATLHVPKAGRQWMGGPRRGSLVPLVFGTGGVLRPDTVAQISRPVGPPGERDGRVRLPSNHRYGQVGRDGESRTVVLSVVDAPTDIAQRFARLFLVTAGSPPTYLGEYDGVTGLSASLPMGESARVVALGPDGSVGFLDVDARSPGRLRLRAQPTGGVVLDEISRPSLQEPRTLELEFRALDGELAGRVFTRLLERDTGWSLSGLLPGLYEFADQRGRTVRRRVEPGRQTVLSLSR